MPKTIKKIASIDIGSNAMRAAFASLTSDGHLKVFKNYRFPLRLGADVFKRGKVSKQRIDFTEKAFNELFMKISKHNITEVYAVATSALRDASNSKQVLEMIKKNTGITVKIIDGDTEAWLIKKAVENIIPLQNKIALLIDIGGGSTEVTLTKNEHIVFSRSYQYGTVRLLESIKLNQIENDIEDFSKKIRTQLNQYLHDDQINICIGTGGNLRRMGKLRHDIFKKPSNRVTLVELNAIYSEMVNLSPEERIKKFDMRQDRADVIIPAMAMIEQILVDNDIYEILLPKVGLKEGILLNKFPSHSVELHLPVKDQ